MTQTIILTEGTDDSRKCDVSKHFPAYILIREYNNNNNNNNMATEHGLYTVAQKERIFSK